MVDTRGIFLGGAADSIQNRREFGLRERILGFQENQAQLDERNKQIQAVRERMDKELEQVKEALPLAQTEDQQQALISQFATSQAANRRLIKNLMGEVSSDEETALERENIATAALRLIPTQDEEDRREASKAAAKDTARFSNLKKLTEREGIDVSSEEILQGLDLLPADDDSKLTVNEKVTTELTARLIASGIPPQQARDRAFDVVNKVTEIALDPETKQPVVVNKLSGTVTPIGGQEVTETVDAAPQQTTLFSSIEKGVGPVDTAAQAISNVPLLGELVNAEDETRAKQVIKQFNQKVKTAVANNRRFPVAEQETIQKLLPKEDTIFSKDDNAFVQAQELKIFLETSLNSAQNTAANKNTSSKKREEALGKIEDIREILNLMGEPDDFFGGSKAIEQEALDRLDAASRKRLLELRAKRDAE